MVDVCDTDATALEAAVASTGAKGHSDFTQMLASTQADCVVLPSYYREGVPRSLLEAASMGKPVITTNSVGCRDTVEDGVTGWLVRPRDVGDLALKITAVIDAPAGYRSALQLNARLFIQAITARPKFARSSRSSRKTLTTSVQSTSA